MALDGPPRELGRSPGCLATAAGGVVLALLSPFAVAVRVVRRRRRGDDLRVTRTVGPFEVESGDEWSRIDVELDVPIDQDSELRRRLTDVVVRVAETLRRDDDVYHAVHRLPGEAESQLLPVGPLLQALGERFALNLTRPDLAGRTVVWLTLPRSRAPAEVLDPFAYDPEAPGEPERLLAGAGARWALATCRTSVGPSVVYRILLFLRTGSRGRIERSLALIDDLDASSRLTDAGA